MVVTGIIVLRTTTLSHAEAKRVTLSVAQKVGVHLLFHVSDEMAVVAVIKSTIWRVHRIG